MRGDLTALAEDGERLQRELDLQAARSVQFSPGVDSGKQSSAEHPQFRRVSRRAGCYHCATVEADRRANEFYLVEERR